MNSDDAMAVINTIAATNSTNEKKEIMEQYPLLKQYLFYAYNPYKKFYMKKTPPKQGASGPFAFTGNTWSILDAMSTRELSGKRAKRLVTSQMKKMSSASAILLTRLIKKDLRCGISVKTINAVFPGLIPEFNILRAEDYVAERVEFPCYVSPKINGLRGPFNQGRFYTRTGRSYQGLNKFADEIVHLMGYEFSNFDGELVIPGMEFNAMSGRLRDHMVVPKIIYFVFDLPDQPDNPFHNRIESMTISKEVWPKWMVQVPHKLVHTYEEIEAYYTICRKQNLEGIMVKTPNHLYHGKRSYDWMRKKPEPTISAPVVHIVPGEEGTKYEHELGAAIVRIGNVKVKVGSGFSDDQRAYYWKHPQAIVGKIIDITYQEVNPSGSLRSPRFDCIREDLT